MTMHRRWVCGTCHREWVFAVGWTERDGCPGCHSAQISQVEYTPAFPGSDVPRSGVSVAEPAAVVEPIPMPLVLIESSEDALAAQWEGLGR